MAAGERPRHLGLDQVGVEVEGIDAHVVELGVAGDGEGEVRLAERGARVALVGQPHLQHQLIGHGPLLEGVGVAHAARQGPGLLLDGFALLGLEKSLAHQDVGNQLGREVHRGSSLAELLCSGAPFMTLPVTALALVVASSLGWSAFDLLRKLLVREVAPVALVLLLTLGTVPLWPIALRSCTAMSPFMMKLPTSLSNFMSMMTIRVP